MPSRRPDVAVEILLIRHAPADHGGRLVGRTDVPAVLPEAAALAFARRAVDGDWSVVSSPARRCRETASALFPDAGVRIDPALWEQDFGVRDGGPLDAMPDLGALDRAALAAWRPEGGESFADMVARVTPALQALAAGDAARVAVVAHGGTVRAALGWALGSVAAGLAFEVAPLSATWLVAAPGGIAIRRVNVALLP